MGRFWVFLMGYEEWGRGGHFGARSEGVGDFNKAVSLTHSVQFYLMSYRNETSWDGVVRG